MQNVIGVRFFANSDEFYPNRTSRLDPGGKVYHYKNTGEVLALDDVVIVRTYDKDNGPFRFAKVVALNGDPTKASKFIVCKLDLTAYLEAEEREKQRAAAIELLKNKARQRGELELLEDVRDRLTPEELAFVERSLGVKSGKDAGVATAGEPPLALKSWRLTGHRLDNNTPIELGVVSGVSAQHAKEYYAMHTNWSVNQLTAEPA